MSSIQGTPGSSPGDLPNSREDEEVNPAGVTPAGQTVSLSATGKNDSIENVQQVALPIIQSDAMASSSILGGAVGEMEVAEIINDVAEKSEANAQQLDENLEAVSQFISSSEEQLEALGAKSRSLLKGTKRSSDRREGVVSQRLRLGSLSARSRLSSVRSSLRRQAREMRHGMGLVSSALAGLHKKLRTVSEEELQKALGTTGKTVLSRLNQLGLRVNDRGEWRLRGDGEVGRLSQSIQDLSLIAERLYDERYLDPNAEVAEEDVATCCSAAKKACLFLQEHLMHALRIIYNLILRFFNWISKKVRGTEPENTGYYTHPGIFINPYASYLGTPTSLEDPRSLRDRLRDGDGSGDDILFSMPQDENLNSESVSDDDRGFR